MPRPILDVAGFRLDVLDAVSGRYKTILSHVDLSLATGEALGLTGRSGGGKTTLALALAGLLPPSTRIWAERCDFYGHAVVPLRRPDTEGRSALERVSLRRLRRTGIRRTFLISQDARSSLIPYRTVGWHLDRAIRASRPAAASRDNSSTGRHPRTRPPVLNRRMRRERVVETLNYLGLCPAEKFVEKLPYQLAGGECQRVQLGMAKLLNFDLLIADEPFASVDRLLRDQLAGQLRDLRSNGSSIILISHDLGLLRELTDRAMVVCNGLVAESGPTPKVLEIESSQHPHTRLLLNLDRCTQYRFEQPSDRDDCRKVACTFANGCNLVAAACQDAIPKVRTVGPSHQYRCVADALDSRVAIVTDLGGMETISTSAECDGADPVLKIEGLGKQLHGQWILRGWTLDVRRGERVGLCAPSGSGKTTLARILMGLLDGTEGRVRRFPRESPQWDGIRNLRQKRALWQRVQLTHQDVDMVFDPAAPVGESLVQAYRAGFPELTARQAWDLAEHLFAEFHLPGDKLLAPPRQLSGGERRRVAMARVLAVFGYGHATGEDGLDRLLILDEPSVGLDVFLQAVVARVLLDAQRRLGLTYLVISHDIQFLRRFCQPIYWLDMVSQQWMRLSAPGQPSEA